MSIAGNNMLKRHLMSLFITIAIYYAPYIIPTNDTWFWIRSSSLSVLYMMLIYSCAKTRVMWLLISIEFLAMSSNLTAWYQYTMSSESQLFNDYYADIMSYCYILEVLTIIGGLMHGRFKRIYSLCTALARRNTNNYSVVYRSKGHICKSPQKA